MATSIPSPNTLIHHAERLVNDKPLFQEAKQTLLEVAKNPDLLENLIAGMGEEEKAIVLRAVELIAMKHRLPSVPPPPPDNGSGHSSEPPKSEPQTP